MTFLWFHDNPTPHNHSVLYSRCYNPFPFQRPPAPVADTSARLSPLAAQVQLLQQSLFLSSEHLVSQRTQCENLPVKLSFSSFCPASIWSRSARSENFPSRALTFSLSSSEHLVSQRTQCEKISRPSCHFPLSVQQTLVSSLTAEKEGANSPDRSLQITTAPRCRPAGPVSPGSVSRHHGPPGQTSRTFFEIPARQTRHSFGGGSVVRRLSSALSLFGGSTLGSGRALSSEPSPRTARQTRIEL